MHGIDLRVVLGPKLSSGIQSPCQVFETGFCADYGGFWTGRMTFEVSLAGLTIPLSKSNSRQFASSNSQLLTNFCRFLSRNWHLLISNSQPVTRISRILINNAESQVNNRELLYKNRESESFEYANLTCRILTRSGITSGTFMSEKNLLMRAITLRATQFLSSAILYSRFFQRSGWRRKSITEVTRISSVRIW